MGEFILIDLRTQMPYLPAYMRMWSRERFLDWLRMYGEIRWLGDRPGWWIDSYVFRSWVGLYATFVLHNAGELSLYVPGTYICAWESAMSLV
jgi:hypothetical protein